MVKRTFWLKKLRDAWKHHSIVWLEGVRRVGKTILSKALLNGEYFDCELPRVRMLLEDPERFLDERRHTVILDEVHRLHNPSEVLKIAADHYPHIKILATGSSILGASKKFRDTLTGRKTEVWLTPMISEDLRDFGKNNLAHRFLHGGLPPFFLAKALPEKDFQEWVDSYWSKDIQELFRLERRHSFQKFFELLMSQSGGIFEATRFSKPCEVSRTTILNYLKVLEATFVTHVIRPFSSHRPTEIVAAPKIYGFDTGFVCFYRGWNVIRQEDLGILWEHYVLNELYAHVDRREIRYWRDKSGHEVDFVLARRTGPPLAIECKWSSSNFDASGLQSFFYQYPKAKGFVVVQNLETSFRRRFGKYTVTFVSLQDLIKRISSLL